MRVSSGRSSKHGGRAAASQQADKKLILLCQHFYPEMISTGMHMTELATRLAELGWQITVLTSKPSWGTDDPDAGPVAAEMIYQNVRILRVPTLGSQRGSLISKTVSAVTFVPSVAWALWRRRADYRSLVITTNPPFVGVLGWLVSRVFRRPYLVIVYDVFPEDVYFDKVTAALSASSPEYDAFMTGAYMTWTYGPAGWIADLNECER